MIWRTNESMEDVTTDDYLLALYKAYLTRGSNLTDVSAAVLTLAHVVRVLGESSEGNSLADAIERVTYRLGVLDDRLGEIDNTIGVKD